MTKRLVLAVPLPVNGIGDLGPVPNVVLDGEIVGRAASVTVRTDGRLRCVLVEVDCSDHDLAAFARGLFK